MTQVGKYLRLRPARPIALPLLAALFALSLAAGDAVALDKNATTVTTIKGANIEIIHGTPSSFTPQRAETAEAGPGPYRYLQAASGWMIDRERDRLVNCFRSNTPDYRKWAIHCVSRSLPR